MASPTTYPSTLLAQSNDPLEIQKADLDLLKKINEANNALAASTLDVAFASGVIKSSFTVKGALSVGGGVTVTGNETLTGYLLPAVSTTLQAFSASVTTAATINQPTVLGTQNFQTGPGSYNAATGVYTVGAAGTYQVIARAIKASTGTTLTASRVSGGVTTTLSLFSFSLATGTLCGSALFQCAVGDTLYIGCDTVSIALTNVYFEVIRVN